MYYTDFAVKRVITVCSSKLQKADNMKKKTEKTSKKRSRCASRTTLSELKQLHKDLRECLEVFKAEIN